MKRKLYYERERQMDENTIQRLLKEVQKIVSPQEVYQKVETKLDINKLLNERDNLSFYEIGCNFSYIGFLEGIEFALRNLETKEDN